MSKAMGVAQALSVMVDQSTLSLGWAETNEQRASQYQEWADYHKARYLDCTEKAKHYRRVAAADREVAK